MTVGQEQGFKKWRGAKKFACQSFFDPILLDRKKIFRGGRDAEFFQIFSQVAHFLPPSPAQKEIFSRGVETENFSIFFRKSLIFLPLPSPGEEEKLSRG